MLRLMQVRFATLALFAVAAVSLTAASAWAFTQENLSTTGVGSSTFADPDNPSGISAVARNRSVRMALWCSSALNRAR